MPKPVNGVRGELMEVSNILRGRGFDELRDKICDYATVEAIVDPRDTRCVRVLDSLVVDVLLGSGGVVEK